MLMLQIFYGQIQNMVHIRFWLRLQFSGQSFSSTDRDGMRNSPFLVPQGPRPFFTPRFPEEQILSLLGSSRSSPKFAKDLENTEFPLNMKISESFQKFVEIFLCFRISLWYSYPTLKYKINAEFFFNFFQNLFEFFGCLSRFLMIFWITHSSKFPKDPEEQIPSSSIPEECKFAIPRLLDSSRNEILRGIAIPTHNRTDITAHCESFFTFPKVVTAILVFILVMKT